MIKSYIMDVLERSKLEEIVIDKRLYKILYLPEIKNKHLHGKINAVLVKLGGRWRKVLKVYMFDDHCLDFLPIVKVIETYNIEKDRIKKEEEMMEERKLMALMMIKHIRDDNKIHPLPSITFFLVGNILLLAVGLSIFLSLVSLSFK